MVNPQSHPEHPAGEAGEHALSEVLDRLEESVEDEQVTIEHIVEHLGQRSFPTLILIPALIAASPASGIPGITVSVGLIVALTAAQMLFGRRSLWLPRFLSRRSIPAHRLCQAIGWLRRPLRFVERFLRPRLTLLVKRPLVYLPTLVMMVIGACMPVLELVPTTGSIAAAAISFFAAGLLTRDGLLILAGLAFVIAVPLVAWQVGFA